MLLFRKDYSGEDLADVERDVYEAFDPNFNALTGSIPVGDDGLETGTFTITIEWRPT